MHCMNPVLPTCPMSARSDDLLALVFNVFLPKNVPQQQQQEKHTQFLLKCLLDSLTGGRKAKVTEASQMCEPLRSVQSNAVLLRLLSSIARCHGPCIQSKSLELEISRISAGETFALLLREQNACVMIKKVDDQFSTFSVFDVSPANADVIEYSNGLRTVYPHLSARAPNEQLSSTFFTEILCSLNSQPLQCASRITTKAGADVKESREPQKALVVFEWLFPLICALAPFVSDECPVPKKIRDVVRWENALLPWRRCPLWITIKVALHCTSCNFNREDALEGQVFYKVIMLQFMATIVRRFASHLSVDLVAQMCSKVARRISKLNDLKFNAAENISAVCEGIMESSSQILCDAHLRLNGGWRNFLRTQTDIEKIDLNCLNFSRDKRHSLRSSWPALEKMLVSHEADSNSPEVTAPACASRNVSIDSLPNLSVISQAMEFKDVLQTLFDVEKWVRSVLGATLLGEKACTFKASEMQMLLREYIVLAKRQIDPLQCSKSILAALTICLAADKAMIEQHPDWRLDDFKTGLSLRGTEHLLLERRDELEQLHTLECYFKRREKAASGMALLQDGSPCRDSYGAVFARRNSAMKKLKQGILRDDERRKTEKLQELSAKQAEYKSAYRRSCQSGCSQSNICDACRLKLRAKYLEIDLLEVWLPTDDDLQDAIMFELLMPEEFGALRDCFCTVRELMSPMHKVDSYTTWQSWLSDCSGVKKRCSVHLASSLKPFKSSHYRQVYVCSANASDVVKPCALNILYSTNDGIYKLDDSDQPKLLCEMCTIKLTSPKYSGLQWTIDYSTHSENDVIASQCDCNLFLPLNQYVAFGSVRAGNRTQFRCLVQGMESGTLSFDDTDVVALAHRACWCAEKEGEFWWRDSHSDFRCPTYCAEAVRVMNKYINSIEDNWERHNSLSSALTIALRMMNLLEVDGVDEVDGNGLVCRFILRCRTICVEWTKKIESILAQCIMTGTASPHEIAGIRDHLVEVCLLVCLTYSVEERNIDRVLRGHDDGLCWLLHVNKTFSNVLLANDSHWQASKDKSVLKLLQFTQLVRTGLGLEIRMQELLSQHEKMLDEFIRHNWPDSSKGIIGCWKRHPPPADRWYEAHFESEYGTLSLQVDILRGDLLIDGSPVCRLPDTITDTDDFRRVFGAFVFDVAPAAGIRGSYCTVHRFGPSRSVFTFARDAEKVVIVERLSDDRNLQLVSHVNFESDFPQNLIDGYSHWVDKSEKIMYFRDKSFLVPSFFSLTCDFKLNLTSREVDVRRKLCLVEEIDTEDFSEYPAQLVDINSTTFRELYDKAFVRIEELRFVHVLTSSRAINNQHSIILPRMGLNFVVGSGGLIHSKNYPGMQIDERQKVGTLIGLRKGLILRHTWNHRKRAILIPHSSKISSRKQSEQVDHHEVCIDLSQDGLSSPRFFKYDIDHRKRELCADGPRMACLYLALLHASTANPLPDPFTGMTGTEKALEILQSARCHASDKLSKQEATVFRNISELTPRRVFYPSHLQSMESVRFPPGLTSLAASDAFYLIAKQLYCHSESMKVFHSDLTANEEFGPFEDREKEAGFSERLIWKGYWRIRNSCLPEGRLDAKNEALSFGNREASQHAWHCPMQLERPNEFEEIRALAGNILSSKCLKLTDPEKNIKALLTNRKQVRKACDITPEILGNLDMLFEWDEGEHWLSLYRFARAAQSTSQQSLLSFLLTLLAFKGALSTRILLTIALNPEEFQRLDPPDVNFTDTSKYTFDSQCISSQTVMAANDFRDRRQHEGEMSYSREKQEFEAKRNAGAQAIASWANKIWISEVNVIGRIAGAENMPFCSLISHDKALQIIKPIVREWYNNKLLYEFCCAVDKKVLILWEHQGCNEIPKEMFAGTCWQTTRMFEAPLSTHSEERHFVLQPPNDWAERVYHEKGSLHVDSKVASKEFRKVMESLPKPDSTDPISVNFVKEIQGSCNLFRELGNDPLSEKSPLSLFRERKKMYSALATQLWQEIESAAQPEPGDHLGKALKAGGLWRRVVPIYFLKRLESWSASETDAPPWIRDRVGALVVLWTCEQRMERCLLAIKADKTRDLIRELQNAGRGCWSPSQMPAWLLFEFEQNLLIRDTQVLVTRHMLDPPENQNMVLQLNMGEGKTSVIVPLLILSIADGQRLAHLTMLNSLFPTQIEALSQKLGGILNRRVCFIPCSRSIMQTTDPEASLHAVRKIKNILESSMEQRGVLVSTPEWRLSLELKTIEHCRARNVDIARELLQLKLWLNKYRRDILDESDEILDIKFNLLYTVGDQLAPSGGELRWKVSQSVLGRVRFHAPNMFKGWPEAFEYAAEPKNTYEFPKVRLLDGESALAGFKDLSSLVVVDMLEGKGEGIPFTHLTTSEKSFLRKVILSSELDSSEKHEIHSKFQGSQLEIILLLRGLFAFDVLRCVLCKRWNVNFGVKADGSRRMAVPFQAKGIATEKNEFGHPDVAIMCTQLSYYSSGLNKGQLKEAFSKLLQLRTGAKEYESWVRTVPDIPNTIRTLEGINFADPTQWSGELFPTFSKNCKVIDFWLNSCVYATEMKVFQGKIAASSWDLASKGDQPVIGFSGTSDTKLLLPLSIKQRDLRELAHTNGEVLFKIHRNNVYRSLRTSDTSLNLLETLTNAGIWPSPPRVLLDVGALIADLHNEEVVKHWLEIAGKEIAAAVYFDENNRLMVLDRTGGITPYQLSSFKQRLDLCIVYLDEIHTRGVDLPFPVGTCACVTLGPRLTKDRLTQACMRMRMLGNGHVCCFLAAHEVHTALSTTGSSSAPGTKEIVEWAIKNSIQKIRQGFLQWILQGVSRCRRQVAEVLCYQAQQNKREVNDAEIEMIAAICFEQDYFPLEQEYGLVRNEESLCTIAERLLTSLKDSVCSMMTENSVAMDIIEQFRNQIMTKCSQDVPNSKIFTSLTDQEVERELETELEEERHQERPGAVKALKPILAQCVRRLASDGIFEHDQKEFCALPMALEHSSVWHLVDPEIWDQRLWCTRDFIDSVEWPSGDVNDQYRKPFKWIIRVKTHTIKGHHAPNRVDTAAYVVISQFEANGLLHDFRAGRASLRASLFMYCPRSSSNQQTFLTNTGLSLPPLTTPIQDNAEEKQLRMQIDCLAGSLYFEDHAQQEQFKNFFGLRLRPFKEVDQEAFDKGWISKTGFVDPRYREAVAPQELTKCKFMMCPVPMLLQLFRIRGVNLDSISSHLGMVLMRMQDALNDSEGKQLL